MDMQQLEEKLDDLVTQAFDDGVSYDNIISAFELKLMALREEQETENE